MPGPAPKRSDQRRRRNEPAAGSPRSAPRGPAKVPRANGKWHPIAKRWFHSLKESGQVVFFESSDWALAEVIAESLSRDLSPKVILDKDGKAWEVKSSLSGSSLAAYLKSMSMLMVTEPDRRRAAVELKGPHVEPEELNDGVSKLDEYRKRARAGGKT